MKINCSELFADSRLHLLVWNRFDEETHAAGLDFMCDLMKDASLSGQVMPLLRPWRRAGYDHYGFTAIIGTCDNPSCELWLQVAGGHEGLAWDAIADWSCSHVARAIAMQSARVSLWEPLSGDYQNCIYCEGSAESKQRGGHPRYDKPRTVLDNLDSDRRPWLLKTIWYRATEVIAAHLSMNGSTVLNPCSPTGGKEILDLLREMLSDLAPAHYGVSRPSDSVDPSAFYVSHMPAFAVNALLRSDMPRLDFSLQHQCVTWPCLYGSREDYLASVETLMKRRWGPA